MSPPSSTARAGGDRIGAALRRIGPPPGPARLLSAVTLIDAVGTGLFLAGSAAFFVRVVGLSPAQVGVGLTITGFLGFVVSMPAGFLADRYGPRRVLVPLILVQVPLYFGYLLVHSFGAFLVVVCLVGAAERASVPVRSALTAALLEGPERIRAKAYMRATYNTGFSLGSLAAGVALGIDTPAAYYTLVLGNAVSLLVMALLTLRLRERPVRADGPVRDALAALRDVPFLSVTALSAVLSLHATLLTVGLPLWVVTRTSAPRSVVAVLLLVNTVLAVLFQVAASRSAETVAGAARAQRRAGVLLAVCCPVLALSGSAGPVLATAILLAGTVGVTAAELYQSAGSWGVSFGLAPPDAQGRYLAGFNLGYSLQEAAGPYVVIGLVVGLGAAGWAGLGALFLLAALAMVPVTGWAERAAAIRDGGR